MSEAVLDQIRAISDSYLTQDAFFEEQRRQGISLGFGDIILASAMSDQVLECLRTDNWNVDYQEPDQTTQYTKHLTNKVGVVAAAMDRVSHAPSAIAVAESGGRAILHYGFTAEEQFIELEKVRKNIGNFVAKPKTATNSMTFENVENLLAGFTFDRVPVLDSVTGRLIGMVTDKQRLRSRPDDLITDRMMSLDELEKSSTMVNVYEAHQIMVDKNIDSLPITDKEGRLLGMYIFSDTYDFVVNKSGLKNVDANGRLQVDIAVPTDLDEFDRIRMCMPYLQDGGGAVVLDTANGPGWHTFVALDAFKKEFQDEVDVVVGNVTDPQTCVALAAKGADAVKSGQASGGACKTYDQTKVGRKQVTTVRNCREGLNQAGYSNTPLISDGGVVLNGDVPAAMAVGADTVVVGTRFAGTDEAPGEKRRDPLTGLDYKENRGMGSEAAMKESAAASLRYGNDPSNLPLPEGDIIKVPYVGPLSGVMKEFRQAIRKSMIYVGAHDLKSFRERVRFERNLDGRR